MGMKAKYKTRQREELLAFLASTPGRHFTAADICNHFKEVDIPIGTTTVYRQMEKFVDQGIVKKYIIDGNSPACFEYIGDGQSGDQDRSFHCKCGKCGDVIHLRCRELSAVVEDHLKEHHGFDVDLARTVFYGLCENCMKEKV